MSIHIGEMSTQMSIVEGDLPLSDAQLNQLVELVLKRMQERERQGKARREETEIRRQAAPPAVGG